jgi:hypothetical protein
MVLRRNAWQKSKQRELVVMAEARGYLAPPDVAANNLAALDSRCTPLRKAP